MGDGRKLVQSNLTHILVLRTCVQQQQENSKEGTRIETAESQRLYPTATIFYRKPQPRAVQLGSQTVLALLQLNVAALGSFPHAHSTHPPSPPAPALEYQNMGDNAKPRSKNSQPICRFD